MQKHFHHETPVRTGGGYTYFSKRACATPEVSLETFGISEGELASLTMLEQKLLSLAAEKDLLQHMKRFASCTLVHKIQDKFGLELLKEFLEYDCGLQLQEECVREGPNGRRNVEETPWRSSKDPSGSLNTHLQPSENSAVLLMLLNSCQLKGEDAKGVVELLRNTLLNKFPDGEEVNHDASAKEHLIDDDCWFVSQKVYLPKPVQKYLDVNKRDFKKSNLTVRESPEEQDVRKKKQNLLPVFNSILVLPKLLREEEENMLLQSLQNTSREERRKFLIQHGLLQDNVHSKFIPELSERTRLWIEPKAFKIHHKKIFTRPASPFSHDRQYHIRSLQKNFHVHKSDKKVTQFSKVQIPQMSSDSSPLQRMSIREDHTRKQQLSNAQHALASHCGNAENYQPSLPVMGTPGSQDITSSDIDLREVPEEKIHKPQQQLINQMTAREPESLLATLTADGQNERQPEDPQDPYVQPIKSSEAKNAKLRGPFKKFIDISSCQQNNFTEINQMQSKMSYSQELHSASKLNAKSDSEDNHEMTSNQHQDTSLPSTLSLQSTGFCKQKQDNSDTKKNKHPFVSIKQLEYNIRQQSEPDSLVHLDISKERTNLYPVQPVTVIPSDALEECKNECQPKAEKLPDTGEGRQANGKAAEMIVTGKQKRECLPRGKRKPLPAIRRNLQRNSQQQRVMMEETQRFRPRNLDFLTKYCIINPERLSFYERIFLKYCNYEETEESRDKESADTCHISFNYIPGGFDHIEEVFIQKKAKENIDIERKIQMILGAGSVSDQLRKVQFKMKTLLERKKHIANTVEELQDQRMKFQETVAEEQCHTSEQKRKKKGEERKETMHDINMDEKEDNWCEMPLFALRSTPSSVPGNQVDTYENLDLKIHLFWNKYKEISSRLSELNDIKRILEEKNKEAYLEAIIQNSKIPPEERRLQSALYRRLHPDKDLVLDINDLEEALQDVNKCLVSPKECSYIFHILELPGQYRLNLELFCIIAALSEKVTQLDPVIKKLINKLDFEALSVRIEKAKDLWQLLQDRKGEEERKTNKMSQGSVSIHSLALELAAGGFSLEAIDFALKKFNRREAGVLSFLDFVTYIPLFVEIHESIVQNPFSLILNTIPDLEDELHKDVNWNTE